MGDLIVGLVILAIIALAGYYVYKAKKRGVKCIGCPDGAACGGNCASCPGCNQGKK